MFKRHIIAWILGSVVLLGVNLWLGDRVVVDQFLHERSMIINNMGESSAERIQSMANGVYRVCCNWLADATYSLFVPPSDDGRGAYEAIKSSHEAFWTSVYMMISRVFVSWEWLMVFWVVLAAAANQGLTRRAIAVTNTAWSSPVRYHVAIHWAVAVLGIGVNYVIWPWSLHPYWVVALMAMLAWVIYIIFANIQPKV